MTEETDWVTVTTADNEALAELAQERLKAGDIPAVLVPGDAASYQGASAPTAIKVPAGKADQARRILGD